MIKRIKLDEIVDRMRHNDETIRRNQPNRSPEIGNANGDGFAIVDITWVSQKSDPGVSLMLDKFFFLRIHLLR